VLRDPRIDEYLLAHQRFSPSMFSTAQYARSATFATDSGK
jgi:sigma-E factor negative regulatory protein RseA